jgi:hypothetical protein
MREGTAEMDGQTLSFKNSKFHLKPFYLLLSVLPSVRLKLFNYISILNCKYETNNSYIFSCSEILVSQTL